MENFVVVAMVERRGRIAFVAWELGLELGCLVVAKAVRCGTGPPA